MHRTVVRLAMACSVALAGGPAAWAQGASRLPDTTRAQEVGQMNRDMQQRLQIQQQQQNMQLQRDNQRVSRPPCPVGSAVC